MKRLEFEWLHYDKHGDTCIRCGDTGTTLRRVVDALSEEFTPQGIEITIKETKLPLERLSESNMVLLNGVPLEDVLSDAAVSENCCESCACLTGTDAYCRTIVREGVEYEDIPEALIVEAARKVAGSMAKEA